MSLHGEVGQGGVTSATQVPSLDVKKSLWRPPITHAALLVCRARTASELHESSVGTTSQAPCVRASCAVDVGTVSTSLAMTEATCTVPVILHG